MNLVGLNLHAAGSENDANRRLPDALTPVQWVNYPETT